MRAVTCAVLMYLSGSCLAQNAELIYPEAAERSIQDLKERAEDESVHIADRFSLRMELAQRLAAAGESSEATKHYLWLWQNTPAVYPSSTGVRGMFLTGGMGKLAAASPEARQAFAGLRDDIEHRLLVEPTWADLSDWVALNVDTLSDHDRVLAWVDRNLLTVQGRKSIERQLRKIDDVLIVHGRWRDLGRVQSDVSKAVSRAHEVVPPWLHGDTILIGPSIAMYEHEVAKLYIALLAADRFVDASQVFDLASVMEPRADLVDAVDRLVKTYPELKATIERMPLKGR